MTLQQPPDQAVFRLPENHCRCTSWQGWPCAATATQEDLLCDMCRMTRTGPGMTCIVIGKLEDVRHLGAVHAAIELPAISFTWERP